MINFKIGSKRYTIAGDWPELSEAQLLAIIPYSFMGSDNARIRLEVLSALVPALKRKMIRKLSDQDKFDLISLTDWVWEKTLDDTGIDHFEFEGVEYWLPKPQLDDMVAIEFAMADLFLKDFVESSDPKLLDKLVATLCRPRKTEEEMLHPAWDGVERLKYNGAIADRKTAAFASLDFSLKVLVLNHFVQQQRFLYANYDIFTKGGESGEGNGTGFDIGWLSLIFDLAEEGIFGDFDKTCYTNMNTLCLYLHKKSLDRKG